MLFFTHILTRSLPFLVAYFGCLAHGWSQIPTRKNVPFFYRGDEYQLALAGGIDNAQVSQGDIDRDGFHDLFVFDRTGDVVMPFIWQPKSKDYRFGAELRANFPIVKDWAIMLDFNYDGIPDIFSSARNTVGIQGIQVNQGYVVDGKLRFLLKKTAFRDVIPLWINGAFTQVAVDNTDIPTFDDVDADGDIDIILFEPGNNRVTWFRNIAIERGFPLDTLAFVYHDRCYGRFVESGLSSVITLSSTPDTCAGARSPVNSLRHAGSTLASIDLNGDGLKDLLVGDLENPHIVALYNGGTKELAWMTRMDVTWPSQDVIVDLKRFLTPSVVDVDHDGRLDVLVSPNARNFANVNNLWYYRNIRKGDTHEFEFVQPNFLSSEMIDLGSGAAPCFLDFNQDGLMDLLIGTEGYYDSQYRQARLILFENKGTKKQPAYHLVDEDYLQFSRFANSVRDPRINFTPAAGDLDGDSDIDLLVGDIGGEFFFCENTAPPGKPFVLKAPVVFYQMLSAFGHSAPTIADLNRDGLNDILTGTRLLMNDSSNKICGSFIYFQNQGTIGRPRFDSDFAKFPNTQCVGGVIVNGFVSKIYTAPAVYDFSGKYKLFCGTFLGQIKVYSNIENNLYNNFTEEHFDFGSMREGERTTVSVADIDDDGILDMVVGNQRGGISIWSTNYKLDGTVATNAPIGGDPVLEVYPSIANEYLFLKNTSTHNLRAMIIASHGQLVEDLELGEGTHLIHIGSLKQGLYYVAIEHSQNFVVKKFIKF